MFRAYARIIGEEYKLKPTELLKVDVMSCILFVVIVAMGVAFQVIKQWRTTESRALKAEAEKANAELAFLKAQINPHFLYNTLNNIYSLSVEQHPQTSESIMKLSNIMRYITDEATQDFVLLEHELACISDYIDLQRLRHFKNVKVDFTVTGEVEDKEIAPLILMTYIENIFKYGISSHEEAPIKISIHADDEKIKFHCQNRIFAQYRITERLGIGQANTRQRLKHLYPQKHDLTINSENGLYTVDLVLYI